MDAVFGAWHGGASYAPFALPDDLERFESLMDAAATLHMRAVMNGPWHFSYVNRDPVSVLCPAVDDDCEMHVWTELPDEPTPPDYIIRLENGSPSIERA